MTSELAEKPMSYEEIIDTLKGLVFGTFDRTTSKEREALSRAIDLLSNTDGDCISREWVLEHQRIVVDDDGIMLPVVDVSIVKKAPNIQPKLKYVAVGNVNFDKAELQKIVDEAIPTIMPEIEYRKAHWQNNACSNCGIYNASAYKNWCPNCGCKMEEEKKADKEQVKSAMEGFTSFMRAICNNNNLGVPKEMADKFGISEEFRRNEE